MASGFLQADVSSTVTLTSTNGGSAPAGTYDDDFAKITLTTHTATGTSIGFPTAGVRWSHFELILVDSQTRQTDYECKVFFTWDSGGDDIAAGPSASVPMVAGRADTDSYMVVIDMDMIPSLPDDGAASTVYAWVATKEFTDATPVLLRARLYWHELTKG